MIKQFSKTPEDEKLFDQLEKLLGGERKVYVVISREYLEGAKSRYKMFTNAGEDVAAPHILNFLDGLLDDAEFAGMAALVAERSIERLERACGEGGKDRAN